MRDCIIIGKPNAGKTLFLINFAEYIGARVLQFAPAPRGGTYELSCSFETARSGLVEPTPHTTMEVRPAVLRIRVGKGIRDFYLTDTPGISEGIHPDPAARSAMAQALKRLRSSDVVLHVVDASKATQPGAPEALGDVDLQIAAFSRTKLGYAVLANKMDLYGSEAGLAYIRRMFPACVVIPTSAARGTGFRQVKAFIVQHV
ncbi:MAG: GTP-binding protein HSR1 [Firmicutes bacterium]|nr:GTP-binding protein HSR1 [Bacillota bacterium]